MISGSSPQTFEEKRWEKFNSFCHRKGRVSHDKNQLTCAIDPGYGTVGMEMVEDGQPNRGAVAELVCPDTEIVTTMNGKATYSLQLTFY